MISSEFTNKNNAINRRYLLMALISIGSLLTTFIVSNADLTYLSKLFVFVSIVVFYVLAWTVIYFREIIRSANREEIGKTGDSPFNAEVEAKLAALEEANQFFGASLKSADMFRLIANRINEIIPYSACALFSADESREKLKLAFSAGGNLKRLIGTEINSRAGLTGKTFQSRQPQIERSLQNERKLLPKDFANDLNSAISVPLLSGENVFAVLVLYSSEENSFNTDLLPLVEAVGARIAPLFLSSRAFESNLTNSLTDALTNLPNERALFLVLENQIAEAQRFRDDRPLTILSIDIKNFGEHNQRFGHVTGDSLLLFAADKIKKQLRGMDFLARSASDEFLAVLPTASEIITREIVDRIEKTFVTNPFETSGGEKVHLQLSFGAASFGKDGETANHLLKHALWRKQQSKSKVKDSKILFFPKEYVN